MKSSELPTPHSYIKHGAVEQSQKDQTVDKELLVKVRISVHKEI